ncbi:hypothetical protein AAF712_012184 [Marasmius tenuissimus]|uniref:Uncharacterized protein n=1 Tax=Marasmius tenuissimus TaxID=585030 RepID=A0ABR2ZH60_9AGAR
MQPATSRSRSLSASSSNTRLSPVVRRQDQQQRRQFGFQTSDLYGPEATEIELELEETTRQLQEKTIECEGLQNTWLNVLQLLGQLVTSASSPVFLALLPIPQFKREDYPEVTVWSKKDKNRGKAKATDGVAGTPAYGWWAQNADGSTVPPEELEHTRDLMRSCWFSMLGRLGEATPPTWTKVPIEEYTLMEHVVLTRYPYLGYCSDGWKIAKVAQDTYPNWYSTHAKPKIAGVKVEAKVEKVECGKSVSLKRPPSEIPGIPSTKKSRTEAPEAMDTRPDHPVLSDTMPVLVQSIITTLPPKVPQAMSPPPTLSAAANSKDMSPSLGKGSGLHSLTMDDINSNLVRDDTPVNKTRPVPSSSSAATAAPSTSRPPCAEPQVSTGATQGPTQDGTGNGTSLHQGSLAYSSEGLSVPEKSVLTALDGPSFHPPSPDPRASAKNFASCTQAIPPASTDTVPYATAESNITGSSLLHEHVTTPHASGPSTTQLSNASPVPTTSTNIKNGPQNDNLPTCAQAEPAAVSPPPGIDVPPATSAATSASRVPLIRRGGRQPTKLCEDDGSNTQTNLWRLEYMRQNSPAYIANFTKWLRTIPESERKNPPPRV